MNIHPPFSKLNVWGIAAPLAVLATAGVLLASGVLRQPELGAAVPPSVDDPDGDGLVSGQESVLGTNAYRPDTDRDGYGDLEELARHSSPLFPQSTPSTDKLELGITCRGADDGMLHALVAVYLPDGDLRGKELGAGVLFNHRIYSLTEGYVYRHASVQLHDAHDAGAKIAVIEVPFSPRYVYAYGQLTVFATVRTERSGAVQAADSMHLLCFGRTIVLQMTNPMILGLGGITGQSQRGGAAQPAIGSIYVPLSLGGGGDPGSWEPGQVCVQQSVSVGVSGAQLTQEVTSAECQEGWDGACPPSCSSTVGNTYTTIDPLVLIGG